MQESQDKTSSQTRSDKRKLATESLPVIPDKRYFAIGEVAHLCGVKPHVLRYWEQEFPQIKPVKRRGNRRYYQYVDVLTIRKIRKLLYDEGFTIEGARAQLMENPQEVIKAVQTETVVKKLIEDLEVVLQKLKNEEVA
jgi:DNA-binding transcriptional MerR regulator